MITAQMPQGPVDVCIIGSGPAGAFTALELARAGLRVAVVEAGGQSASPTADPREGLDRIDLGSAAQVALGRAWQLGGASNLWAGRIAPLCAVDFHARSGQALSGWPITARDMAPHYRRAAELLGAPEPLDPPLPAPLRALVSQPDLAALPFVWAARPFNAADALRRAMADLPQLSVTLHARCVALRQGAEGQVIAACLRRPDGSRVDLQARSFVLAAGGLDVVRLLFNSTDACAQGLGNRHGMLGRCFSTHPKADLARIRLRAPLSVRNAVLMDQAVGAGRMRLGLGLSAQAQAATGTLNHYVQLSPMTEHRATLAFEGAQAGLARSLPGVVRQAALTRMGLWAFERLGRAAGLQGRARQVVVRGFLDQHPDPSNRLSRAQSTDSAGVARLDVHWRFTAADRASVLAFLGHLDLRLQASGIGALDHAALQRCADWPLTALHSHFMGGTRMGTDPRLSVTDPEGRVHGVANLFIAGPSLFPTYGHANPVLTIAALSLRLGAHLAAALRRQAIAPHPAPQKGNP